MDSRNNTRAKMIVWLRDAIEHEIGKPDDEIDYELVDELTRLLSELMGDQKYMTDEEVKQKLAQIMGRKPKEVKRKPRIKLKRLVMIACAAMVMVGGTMAIGAFDGSARSKMWAAFTSDNGDTFGENGVTYTNMNNPTTYSSIEKLVEEKALDINNPSILPDGVKIEKVLYYNENSIVFKFNDDLLQMEICSSDYLKMDDIVRNSKKLKIHNIETYITQKNKIFSSYTILDDKIYVITSNTEEKIETILNGLLGD